MSQLRTPDPGRAKAFYGEAFGWETDTFRAGDSEITLWRVPGYVGGEPQQPVSREVVGTMIAIGEDRCAEEPPPHWSVDFWVSDADATAEKDPPSPTRDRRRPPQHFAVPARGPS